MARVKEIKTSAQTVSIELGGKNRLIKYDLNAFSELELKFGTIQQAMDALKVGQMKDIKVILWAGLIHEEAILDEVTGEPVKYNITPYQVGSWITVPMIPDVVMKMTAAMDFGMPDIKNNPGAKAQLEKALAEQGLTLADLEKSDTKNS